MKKRYISLIELLAILAVTTVTGSMASKLFVSFTKENVSLQKHQQNQRDFKNIIRTSREWAIKSGPGLDQVDKAIFSGSNEINMIDGKIYFRCEGNELVHKIPKDFKVSFSTELGPQGEGVLVIQGQRNELTYSLKLPMGETNEKK